MASISGFGIGSLVTPLLATQVGTKMGVAIVVVPHFVATTYRFLLLRKHLNWPVFLHFGILSALGGLTGAILNQKLNSPALTLIFGIILVTSGTLGATPIGSGLKFHGVVAGFAGAVSGFLGGLVGNQGGIRSAALLGFQLNKTSFVATATAVGVVVDLFRAPIYFYNDYAEISLHWNWIGLATIGTFLGTLLGMRFLKGIPEAKFKKIVSTLILILGLAMIAHSIMSHSGHADNALELH